MSCCSRASATTTSPTRARSCRPPAVPVKIARSTPNSPASSVAVAAAATLPTPESTATTSWPSRWPIQKRRPARSSGASSGMQASSDASSWCMALTIAIRPIAEGYLLSQGDARPGARSPSRPSAASTASRGHRP